ncbi:MAG: class II fructose-bisphosphate aldolase [Spirochaetes bacterium]|jgi:ketose-bisphosphate aldolase|nr:class II fructose-bisphosphate aldolase [Spirochaetota bacterium]
MRLIPSGQIVKDASKEGYAVAAINCQGGNYDIVRAVLETADEERAPVILMAYEKNTEYYGLGWLPTLVSALGHRYSIPVGVHLDHGQNIDAVEEAVDLGYTSVMIDYSTKPLEENIKATSRVIAAARNRGVSVEAELGELLRNQGAGARSAGGGAGAGGNPGVPSAAENLVDPRHVERFLSEAPVDMLAVGIGNAHGFYKGTPNIRLDLLQEVTKVSGGTPLVLHGTTGIPPETVKACISNGMAKINFGTAVRVGFIDYITGGANGDFDHKGHIWRLCRYAKDRVKEDIRTIIRLTGSAGRA